MTTGRAAGYDSLYGEFDSPLMRQVRLEAYGEDIGQHSWVRADELRRDIGGLKVTSGSRLVDLGCGPCGPLTLVLASVRCRGTGMDESIPALAAGRARAAALGLGSLMTVQEADLNEPLPLSAGSFDAALCLDVVLHVRDRERLFREVARVLAPGGRLLLTDAGILTGPVTDEELSLRSGHGHTQFVAPGFNERVLEASGFTLLESGDRTASVLKNAVGRLEARQAYREELEQVEGPPAFERQQRYLEMVVELSRRGAVSRTMYLAERKET